jgi:tetratricopeptide (TPR) repeat protein
MTGVLDLHATVRVHHQDVASVRTAPPERLEISRNNPVALPLPPGMTFLVRAGWIGLREVEVETSDGGIQRIRIGEAAVVELGPVQVELRLAERVRLRRSGVVGLAATLSWMVVVFSMALSFSSEAVFERVARCTPVGDWLGLACPSAGGASGGGLPVEALERLLKKEFDGAESGRITDDEPETVARFEADGFVPAGDVGPLTEQGGAEQVAPVPRRVAPPKPKVAAAPKRPAEAVGEAGQGKDGTIAVAEADAASSPAQGEGEQTDGMSPDGEDDEDEAVADGLAEEKKGWGVRDWMDAAPKQDKDAVETLVKRQERLVRIDPDDIDSIGLLAYYQYLQEDYEAAEKSFDRVIELYPEMSGGYNNKALVYKRRGEYAKEEGLYRLALAIDPGDPTALNNLAVCLAHQGRFGEAMRVMDEVERQLPDDAYTWLHRAKILAAKGDDEAALAQLRRALDGIRKLDLMHHIEFRQDLRLDPAFVRLRKDERFFALLEEFYGSSSPVGAGR